MSSDAPSPGRNYILARYRQFLVLQGDDAFIIREWKEGGNTVPIEANPSSLDFKLWFY